MGFLKYYLDGPAEIKFKKAKQYLNRGHIEFDKKDYKGAIYQYKTGITNLKWIDIRFKSYKGDRRFLKFINLMQTLWGWLSRAYRETGAEILANECLVTWNKYMNLEKNCVEIYVEKKRGLELRNREFLPFLSCYIVLESIIFIVGLFLAYKLTNLFIFVGLFITTCLPPLLYIIFNFHFRKIYSFRYKAENLRTEFSRIPDIDKPSVDTWIYFTDNFNFLLLTLLFICMPFYLALLMNLGAIVYSHALTAYLIMPITSLLLIFLHGIIFCFTDWYEKKK